MNSKLSTVRSPSGRNKGKRKKLPQLEKKRSAIPSVADQDLSKAKVGRPRGKKSNPEFISTTVYIRKDTRKAVKHLLLDRDDKLDLSAVVEQQLSEWVISQPQTQ